MSTESLVKASYGAIAGRTAVVRVHEAGALRLRHPRGGACEGVLVNTAGGVVAGDRLGVEVAVGEGAAVTLTSAAAEKIYRSEGAEATIVTRLTLAPGSRIAWIPQETIVFDGARLRRRFEVDLAEDATLVAAEIVVFGRAASGERAVTGRFRDSWRVRRANKLVFADETRLESAIGATLARPAVADGAEAAALVLVAMPEAGRLFDPLRAAIAAQIGTAATEGGASSRDGIIVARLIGRGEPLRRAVADMLAKACGISVPRVWQ